MGSSIAEKYSRLLNEDDVVTLFGKLESAIGNRKEAAERCGLTRKAVYNWKSLTQPMKANTKEKVLEQLLELMPVEILEYLAGQLFESTSEVLMSYFVALYENAFATKESKEFTKLADKFEAAKKEYAGLVHKRYEYELEELTTKLEQYGKSIGTSWNSVPYSLFDTETLKATITELVKSPSDIETSDELAIRLGVPIEVVNYLRSILIQQSYTNYTLFNDWMTNKDPNIGVIEATPQTSGSVTSDIYHLWQTKYENKDAELDVTTQAATAASMPTIIKSRK